jgi:hypothetical protein
VLHSFLDGMNFDRAVATWSCARRPLHRMIYLFSALKEPE